MTEQLTLTVDPLLYAVRWTEQNPDAWAAVVSWAHRDREMGIPPRTRTYCCLLRHPLFASDLGVTRMGREPVLVNDHLSADLARLLNRLYPHLQCPTREAAADRWAS